MKIRIKKKLIKKRIAVLKETVNIEDYSLRVGKFASAIPHRDLSSPYHEEFMSEQNFFYLDEMIRLTDFVCGSK